MSEASTGTIKSRLLTPEQQAEGYWVERAGEAVRVWHGKNNIAYLLTTGDVRAKVQDVVSRRIAQLKDVAAKTGWTPETVELPDWAEREPDE